MPRAIDSALLAHLRSDKATICMIWRIERTDGQVFGFTDHDRPVVFGGLTYQPAYSGNARDLQTGAASTAENTEIEVPVDLPITEQQIAARVWSLAKVDARIINWAAPDQGSVRLPALEVGEIRMRDGRLVVELRGWKHRLAQPIGRVVQAGCDAELGDSRCGVNLTPLTVTGTVTAVTDAQHFSDAARTEAADYFTHGVITWTGGANAGARMEIKRHAAGGVFTLFAPMAYAVAVGDAYSMVPGCDKRFATCVSKFANGTRYRGFPYVPGSAALREGGSA